MSQIFLFIYFLLTFRNVIVKPRQKEAKKVVTQSFGLYHRRNVCCFYTKKGKSEQ